MAKADAVSMALRTGTAPATARWVERAGPMDPAIFRARYARTRRPVVLSGAVAHWPALQRFSPEFFQREYGNRVVRVRGRQYRLGEIVALQQASSAAAPAPYPCTLYDCSGLLADMPRPECTLPSRHASSLLPTHVFDVINHLEVFFGGPGGTFPYLHYDMLHMHAWIAQVYGDKEFTLYEPGQEDLLYVNPQMPWVSTAEDARDFQRYPLLRKARSHTVIVHPGDLLFIPCGIWHTARCLGPCITVAFDQLEPCNWTAFRDEVAAAERRNGHPLKALAEWAWLTVLGPLFSLAERFGAHRNVGLGVN